jgi:RNA polymerase sigma-70 factor (ECF subfamily)
MHAVALKTGHRFNLLRGFWLAQDDNTLVKLVLRGDLRAEDELISRHYGLVYRVAYGILCERHGALDTAQNLFARLRRLLRSFDGRSALKSYLYRVAVNAALDELRRRKRRARTASLDEIQLSSNDVAGRALEVSEVVNMVLSVLPARQRAAVVLRDIEGLSTEEAAVTMRITPSGLRSILAEGRLRMKQIIEKRFPEFSNWGG